MAPKNPPPRQPPVGYPNTNPLRKEEQITAGNRFFRDQHTTFSPKEWYDHVYRHAEEYKTCSVLSFTQFKDLNSRYKHEYISFLVEDSVTQLRAQIIAERDTNRDVVFVGQMKKPPSSDKPLALRLRTLVFSKTNRPAIIAVAVILVSFSKVGGKYQLLFNNCFWFSRTIHKVLKVHYGDASETLSTKIKPGDFTYPSLFKNSFTAKAKQFVEEQNKEWDVIQETIILVANKKKFIAELAEQQKLKNYKDSMSHIGFDVDEAAVVNAANAAKAELAQHPTQEEDWAKELDETVTGLASLASKLPADQQYKTMSDLSKKISKEDPAPVPEEEAPTYVQAHEVVNMIVTEVLNEAFGKQG